MLNNIVTFYLVVLFQHALLAQIENDKNYRFINNSLGQNRSIDNQLNENDVIYMAETGGFSGQYWSFKEQDNGFYQIMNSDNYLKVDLNNGNAPTIGAMKQVDLAPTQLWKIIPQSNGANRITNVYLGDSLSLSISSDDSNNVIMRKTGNYFSQYWFIDEFYTYQSPTNIFKHEGHDFLPTGNGGYNCDWFKGYCITKDGEKIEGMTRLSGGSSIYRTVRIDNLIIINDDGKSKFKMDEIQEYGDLDYKVEDVKNDNKKEFKNLHPGYIVYKDGKRKEGLVARYTYPVGSVIMVGLIFADKEGFVTKYPNYEWELSEYGQKINSEYSRYVVHHGYYVPMKNSNGRFCYYRNNSPTHAKEISDITNVVGNAIASQAEKRLGDKNNPNYNEPYSYQDMSIYFSEFYVLDTLKNSRGIIYKENAKTYIMKKLGSCEVSMSAINEVADNFKIKEYIDFLESNSCK